MFCCFCEIRHLLIKEQANAGGLAREVTSQPSVQGQQADSSSLWKGVSEARISPVKPGSSKLVPRLPMLGFRRMSCTQSDAERKFWWTPELLEQLMPLLDATSASNLAEAHPFTVEVLQGGSTWKQLVESSCKYWESTRQEFEETFEQKKTDIGHLVNILKKMENPDAYMRVLLEIICQKTTAGGSIYVVVSCASHKSHKVSPLGFVLLEEVESTFGTAEQEILTPDTLYLTHCA